MCFRKKKLKFKKRRQLYSLLCDLGVYALEHHQKEMYIPRHQKKYLWSGSLSHLEVLQTLLLCFTTSNTTFYIFISPIFQYIQLKRVYSDLHFAFCT